MRCLNHWPSGNCRISTAGAGSTQRPDPASRHRAIWPEGRAGGRSGNPPAGSRSPGTGRACCRQEEHAISRVVAPSKSMLPNTWRCSYTPRGAEYPRPVVMGGMVMAGPADLINDQIAIWSSTDLPGPKIRSGPGGSVRTDQKARLSEILMLRPGAGPV